MDRKLAWTGEAWQDYIYWQTQDKKTLKRINKLIDDTMRQPSGLAHEKCNENIKNYYK